jgi:hypothetical protein
MRWCRRLMTAPGVGAVVALTYRATVDQPQRFVHSRAVGAHVGLTPKRYQSGEIDYDGGVSECGDALLRMMLYEAAHSMLTHGRKWSWLKAWGMRVAQRRGYVEPSSRSPGAWPWFCTGCGSMGASSAGRRTAPPAGCGHAASPTPTRLSANHQVVPRRRIAPPRSRDRARRDRGAGYQIISAFVKTGPRLAIWLSTRFYGLRYSSSIPALSSPARSRSSSSPEYAVFSRVQARENPGCRRSKSVLADDAEIISPDIAAAAMSMQ